MLPSQRSRNFRHVSLGRQLEIAHKGSLQRGRVLHRIPLVRARAAAEVRQFCLEIVQRDPRLVAELVLERLPRRLFVLQARVVVPRLLVVRDEGDGIHRPRLGAHAITVCVEERLEGLAGRERLGARQQRLRALQRGRVAPAHQRRHLRHDALKLHDAREVLGAPGLAANALRQRPRCNRRRPRPGRRERHPYRRRAEAPQRAIHHAAPRRRGLRGPAGDRAPPGPCFLGLQQEQQKYKAREPSGESGRHHSHSSAWDAHAGSCAWVRPGSGGGWRWRWQAAQGVGGGWHRTLLGLEWG
mmetsp:Transcript_17984/g.55035  ORF Transcript_17984/g.55035 Transcript_17984/m.55035 type:complete len:299 (+) Transcript_17984:1363-2259(+)